MDVQITKSKVDLDWDPDIMYFDFEVNGFWYMIGFKKSPLTWVAEGSPVHGVNRVQKTCPLCGLDSSNENVCSGLKDEEGIRKIKKTLLLQHKMRLLLAGIEVE